ncbi:MAG: hypothetical protein HQL15_03395 [Candidatus Omnitrophica bacterium]|nr:hypothetical protein [Candidatus Omnitrophota bacterium]
MKILALIVTLLVSIVTTPAFSEEAKKVDLMKMYEMVQAMKHNEALMKDPAVLAAMSRIAEAYKKVHPVNTK